MADLVLNSLFIWLDGGPYHLWIAVFVTLAFTALARMVRGVSISGAIAGAAVCFVLIAGAGLGAFALLVTVFGLTWLSTRFGYRRKQELGTAQAREGRTASQVLANLAVSAISAGLLGATGRSVFLLGTTAALAEAAADTVSSELGQTYSEKARLITTWKEVPAGTDGGVTLLGTAAGVVAALLIGAISYFAGLTPIKWAAIAVSSAFLGMLADSYLGASLERRKLLTNDWVNLLGTLVAAGTAMLVG